MGGTAFIVEEQIEQLISRGLKIIDKAKAKETLLDIGYYRLGFYWYYFQDSKSHKFMYDISLDDIVKLYYFDFDIKHLLSKYIYRIEVHFRTQIIYYVSNHYKNNNQWYIDPAIINKGILKEFNNIYYTLKQKIIYCLSIIQNTLMNLMHLHGKFLNFLLLDRFLNFIEI